MDPITLLAAGTLALSMASDRMGYLLGKKRASIPSMAHAGELVRQKLAKKWGVKILHDVYLMARPRFDGEGMDVAWEGSVLYDRPGDGGDGRDHRGPPHGEDELTSHNFTVRYSQELGRFNVELVSGRYGTSKNAFRERLQLNLEKTPSLGGDRMMPAPLIVGGLVSKALAARGETLVELSLRPLVAYDREPHDTPWSGSALYRTSEGVMRSRGLVITAGRSYEVELLEPSQDATSDGFIAFARRHKEYLILP